MLACASTTIVTAASARAWSWRCASCITRRARKPSGRGPGCRTIAFYRSYLSQARRHLPRHRGKSPHQVAYFTRSLRLQEETALLASVLSLLGVLPAVVSAAPSAAASDVAPHIAAAATAAPAGCASLRGVTRGMLLCQAFEAFRLLLPSAQISFEHAVFLATALARGDQLRLGDCSDCGSLMVTERFPLRNSRCTHCALPAQPG